MYRECDAHAPRTAARQATQHRVIAFAILSLVLNKMPRLFYGMNEARRLRSHLASEQDRPKQEHQHYCGDHQGNRPRASAAPGLVSRAPNIFERERRRLRRNFSDAWRALIPRPEVPDISILAPSSCSLTGHRDGCSAAGGHRLASSERLTLSGRTIRGMSRRGAD
jgi:hypothetical protein